MAKNMKLKTQRIEENKDRRAKAIARYIRISPYKVRVVLDNIRGKSVNDAVAILENTSKAGAVYSTTSSDLSRRRTCKRQRKSD